MEYSQFFQSMPCDDPYSLGCPDLLETIYVNDLIPDEDDDDSLQLNVQPPKESNLNGYATGSIAVFAVAGIAYIAFN